MIGEHHNLVTEFPEFKDKIHELKASNHHFQRLAEKHHELDKQIRHYETGTEAVADETLEDLKKQRLHLRDEIYQLLKNS